MTTTQFTIPAECMRDGESRTVPALDNPAVPFVLQRGWDSGSFVPLKTWAGNGHILAHRATGRAVAKNIPKRAYGPLSAALLALPIDWNADEQTMKEQFRDVLGELRSWCFLMARGY